MATSSSVLSSEQLASSSNSTSIRTRSLVWRHFTKTSEKEVVCEMCGELIISSGNTSNLFKVCWFEVTNLGVYGNLDHRGNRVIAQIK